MVRPAGKTYISQSLKISASDGATGETGTVSGAAAHRMPSSSVTGDGMVIAPGGAIATLAVRSTPGDGAPRASKRSRNSPARNSAS